MPTDERLLADVMYILHKQTLADKVLDDDGVDAKLEDLDLKKFDFFTVSGYLSHCSHGYGGRAIFATEVQACETVAELHAAYKKVVGMPKAKAAKAGGGS